MKNSKYERIKNLSRSITVAVIRRVMNMTSIFGERDIDIIRHLAEEQFKSTFKEGKEITMTSRSIYPDMVVDARGELLPSPLFDVMAKTVASHYKIIKDVILPLTITADAEIKAKVSALDSKPAYDAEVSFYEITDRLRKFTDGKLSEPSEKFYAFGFIVDEDRDALVKGMTTTAPGSLEITEEMANKIIDRVGYYKSSERVLYALPTVLDMKELCCMVNYYAALTNLEESGQDVVIQSADIKNGAGYANTKAFIMHKIKYTLQLLAEDEARKDSNIIGVKYNKKFTLFKHNSSRFLKDHKVEAIMAIEDDGLVAMSALEADYEKLLVNYDNLVTLGRGKLAVEREKELLKIYKSVHGSVILKSKPEYLPYFNTADGVWFNTELVYDGYDFIMVILCYNSLNESLNTMRNIKKSNQSLEGEELAFLAMVSSVFNYVNIGVSVRDTDVNSLPSVTGV